MTLAVGGETVELRQHNRYRLAASVSFSWETANRCVQHGHGTTRDCGVSGAFVISPNRLPIGSIVQMDFSLPPLRAAGRGARLRARGRVVRTESQGFAIIADMGPGSLLQREQSLAAFGDEAFAR